MGKHVIIGAGGVGTATATALASAGHDVVVASRSGRQVGVEGVVSQKVDATDPQAIARLAQGAVAIYNCVNPEYHRWAQDWPPMASALLVAAEITGAGLVTMSNLYGYGPVDHPMTTADPLVATYTNGAIRAEMWHEALAAHAAGRVRVTEARASDFFGPGVVDQSACLGRLLPRLLEGKKVSVLGDPDQPHTWTYVPDAGITLAALGTSEDSWGAAWHVPSGPPLTQRELLEQAARVAGVAPARVGSIPQVAFAAVALFQPKLRPLKDTSYQFTRPFIMESEATSRAFGITATDLDTALEATIEAARTD
jgi:nucleoside-diphosphate-sugar epimerase